MTDDLFQTFIEIFNLPETLSPKEAWKREHQVLTLPPSAEAGETDPTDELGFDGSKWVAWVREDGQDGPPNQTHWEGETEEEALFNLARANNLKFYLQI